MSKLSSMYTTASAKEDFFLFHGTDDFTRTAAKSLLLRGLDDPGITRDPATASVMITPVLLSTLSSTPTETEGTISSEASETIALTHSSTKAIRFHCPTDNLHRKLFHGASFHDSIRTIFKGLNTADVDEDFVHRILSPWNSKSAIDRLLVISSYYSRRKCLSFSVRFGQRMLKSIGANPDRAFQVLRNRLVALNRLGPVVLVLESGAKGVYHLHGLVETTEEFAVVRERLLHLGGHSSNAFFRNLHQVDIKNVSNAMGWANYLVKEVIELPEDSQERRIYISRSAALVGRQQLAFLRQQCETKLSLRPERRGRSSSSTTPRDDAGRFCIAKTSLN